MTAEVLTKSLPTTFCKHSGFATGWAGALNAVLDVTQQQGTVDMGVANLSNGLVRYAIRWT